MRNRSLIQLINATNPMSIAPTTMATRKPSRMYSQSFFEMLGEYILDGFRVAIVVGAMLIGFVALIVGT